MCQHHTPQPQPLPTFETEEDAFEWMWNQVDDPCQDNERLAWTNDAESMRAYEEARDRGCCGFFDTYVIIDGRRAVIGCNYGH